MKIHSMIWVILLGFLIQLALLGIFFINTPETLPDHRGQAYAVWWPSRFSQIDIVDLSDQAGGSVSRFSSQFPNISIIVFPHTPASNLPEKLMDMGASIVFNPVIIGGCSDSPARK